MHMDADERLDYVLSSSPALTDEHLRQIVTETDKWLNNEARDRMRTIAREFVTNREDPHGILLQWLTEEELARLQIPLAKAAFPDPILATCYALCEAYGVAHAAYFIHRNRVSPQTDPPKIEQSKEETEADLRFVNLR